MAIKFEFYHTPVTSGKDEKRYYPKVVNMQHIDTDKLAQEIHTRCTLTVSDVKSVLVSLSEQLAYHLRNGERVHVEGLGYFQVTLEAPEVCNPKAVRANKVKVKTVRFRPDVELKSLIGEADIERSQLRPHSRKWTPEAMDKRLTEYFQTEKILTRRTFQAVCDLTETTAARQIKRLLAEGKLKNISTRIHPVYVPAEGWYGN